jgi:hypothetical protein
MFSEETCYYGRFCKCIPGNVSLLIILRQSHTSDENFVPHCHGNINKKMLNKAKRILHPYLGYLTIMLDVVHGFMFFNI